MELQTKIYRSVVLAATVTVLLWATPAPSPAQDASTIKGLQWSQAVNGLQMAVKLDFPAGVIHFWIRNAEDHEITYNSFGLHNWECVDLEVQDPAGAWTLLDRYPSGIRLYHGVGPQDDETKRLPAHQVIKNPYPMENRGAGTMGPDDSAELPPPTNIGGTDIVDLGDFQWPESTLRQPKFMVRVIQAMPRPGDTFPPWGSGAILSSPVQLDGTTMRNFLATYSPKGRVH